MIVDVKFNDSKEHEWLIYFQHKSATANISILQDDRNVAYLYDFQSVNRNQGEGSALLQEIIDYCVSREISLFIEVDPFDIGNDGLDSNRLENFYKSFGAFQVDTHNGHVVLQSGYSY